MEGVFRFKSWFLNAPRLIHGGAYYRNSAVLDYNSLYVLYLPNWIIDDILIYKQTSIETGDVRKLIC